MKHLGAEWFVRIRWAAVCGQLLVFAGARWLVGIELSALPIVAISGSVALSNLLLSFPLGRAWLEKRSSQGIVLVFDTGLLTALLYFYGGHTNPFSMVYLVHVVIAAMLLGAAWTWGISILCSLCYAALFRWYVPVQELSMHHHMASDGTEFNLHLQGMLVGFVLIAFLVSGFLQRMRAEIDWREQELVRRRSNEEKLAAVTTLAASVAHELGTPLGSMMLVLDEMRENVNSGATTKVSADIDVLTEQLDRCSVALTRLGQSSGELFGEMPVNFAISDFVESLRTQIPAEELSRVTFTHASDLPQVKIPKEGFRHVVTSLVKNAIEATAPGQPIEVSIGSIRDNFYLTVADSGTGISPQELARIGEPFFTTKDSGRGMGLGLFISKLFTERLGGTFNIQSIFGKGTTVRLELPRVVSWGAAS